MWSISILTVIQKSIRKRPWRGFFSWRISTFYLHACILFNLVESYHTCLFSCLHTCIRFLILVFFVLAQYEMLVLCNPLSKCPPATPFLFLLARTQYYFFLWTRRNNFFMYLWIWWIHRFLWRQQLWFDFLIWRH